MFLTHIFCGFWLQSGDTQTFAQKLQLRVPSMESLFRSPLKESLFRSSSKESLVRTSSRESLNRLDLDLSAATIDPPSDMESETEDSLGNLDSLNKEQLIQWLRRMERRLNNYKGKCSEVGACLFCLTENFFPLFSNSCYCVAFIPVVGKTLNSLDMLATNDG